MTHLVTGPWGDHHAAPAAAAPAPALTNVVVRSMSPPSTAAAPTTSTSQLVRIPLFSPFFDQFSNLLDPY